MMGLTPAPVEAYGLAWIALIPLWLVTQSPQFSTSLPSQLLRALAWGIGYHGLALFWITGVHPMTWLGVPWLASLAIAAFCWLFITLWGSVLVVAWTASLTFATRFLNQKNPLLFAITKVIIGAALWCGLETLWSWTPLWWTSLSYTQSPYNLAILQLSQLSGPATVTAAIVIINGLIAEALLYNPPISLPHLPTSLTTTLTRTSSPHKGLITTALVLLTTFHLIGWQMYQRPITQPENAAIEVGIIQGNIPNEIKLYREGLRKAFQGYTKGYKTLVEEGAEVILTPEGALPYNWNLPPEKMYPLQKEFYQAILSEGIPVWLGGFRYEGNSYTNSLFTFTGKGEIYSHYDKVNLVPLGEYVPFESIIGGLVQRLSPLDEHQVHGKPKQIFNTPFGQAVVGICYDSTFARHFRWQTAQGGEFALTASNNAHYSPTMPAQHHAQDVIRAIESDRWMARATNTGYSGIVDPRGNTLWLSGINTYELHKGTIYKSQTITPYVRWGDWLTIALLLISGVLLVITKLI